MLANSISQFINVDSAFKESPIPDVTAEDIESLVSMLAFRNFDSVEKRLHFVLELYTCEPSFWTKLAAICSGAYFLKTEQEWVLVFPATIDCGYVRTYRFRPRILTVSPEEYCQNIRTIQNSEVLYGLLDTPVAQHVFNEWEKANSETVTLPTEFVNGRLANTSVERAIILKRGDGCVICGSVANFCAATTIGDSERAIMIQLPVCLEHLNEAKSYPSVFSFFAFLFHLSIDINDLEKSPNIPDELIPAIHSIVAVELQGRIGSAGKREKGWHLWVELETGWKWLLRLNSLTDYAICFMSRTSEENGTELIPSHIIRN